MGSSLFQWPEPADQILQSRTKSRQGHTAYLPTYLLVLRILIQRIRIILPDPDPHQYEKWDPDPHQHEKWDPDPHQNVLDPPHWYLPTCMQNI